MNCSFDLVPASVMVLVKKKNEHLALITRENFPHSSFVTSARREEEGSDPFAE
jgi:hypothetical protein